MRAEFRLLGEVEALLDGRPAEIGHARQRWVLAALLLDLNHPVAVDALIDRVWADRPPYRARNTLSAYVSRLRAGLAGASGVRLARVPSGYTISAEPRTVDLHRFRGLVVRARAADRPADAAALYEQALELWHGDPFATVDTPWFASVRATLDAERHAVTLDRNDAALRAGAHADLLVGLVDAARTHPLDERLAGQLMLAQCGSGRQGDALATYQRMRDRLRDELGADPAAVLRRIHQQILTGEIGGVGEPGVAAGVGAGESAEPLESARRTSTLPRRLTSFVGRLDAVARVSAALVDGVVGGGTLVTLTGVGGVGKTRLALEVADGAHERFPDGVWLCELAPLDDGEVVSHAVAAALGVQQRHGLTVDQTVIEYLRARALLLVVDNCEHVRDAVACLLDQIARQCFAVSVLATSREALGVDGEQVLPVPPLPAEDAAVLFDERARANRPDFRIDDQAVGAVAEICRRLDGLPLGIELAAARMRAMNALEVARRLDPSRLVGRQSPVGSPRHQSLAAAVDWSYRLLSRPERSLFARLSVFAGGFDLAAAHAVCADPGTTEDDTLELLIGLVDKSMVATAGGAGRSRYRVLETLRAFGRERLRDTDGDQLARRHATSFTALAEQAALGLHSPDEQAWVERLLPDYDNLRAAFERAVADRDGDLAARLVTSLPELVYLRIGYETAGWAERTLDLTDPDHPQFAAAVGSAARGAWNNGDFARVRALVTRAGGRRPLRGTGRIAYPDDVLADVALYTGDAGAALRHYDAELDRARRDDDPIRLVWTLYYIAVCHAVQRDPEAGLAAARESVEVADTTANPTARSMARYALGLVLKKSDPKRALMLFDEAAELAASVRNLWWHGIALMEAAATRGVHADPTVAARAFLEVLDHWDRVGDWTQQWLNLRYVARLLVRFGADADAVALHHALLAAGKPSPFRADRLAVLAEAVGSVRYDPAGHGSPAADAVGRARATLRRYV